MKKSPLTLFGLALALGLFGCAAADTFGSSSSEQVEGGPHSPIAGYYCFESYDAFLAFYDVFKGYNAERYWVPMENDDLNVEYCFETLGIPADVYNAKRYDIDFDYQTMYARISDERMDLTLTMSVLEQTDFKETISASEIAITICDCSPKMNKFEAHIAYGPSDLSIASGILTLNDEETDFISEYSDVMSDIFYGAFADVF